MFVPDQHLGSYVKEQTGRDLILWPGYCISHVVILREDIEDARKKLPDAVVMCHPECTEEVKALSDEILSTGQMLQFADNTDHRDFIVATETGIIHTLEKQNPDKTFIPASNLALCTDMKKITLDKLVLALEEMKFEVKVPDDVRTRAKKALDRMIEVLPSK